MDWTAEKDRQQRHGRACGWLVVLSLAILLSASGEKPLELVQRQAEVAAGNYAVVVGVDTYADSRIAPLRFAEADAHSFAEALRTRCGYPASHVFELTGPQATLEGILDRVNALSDRSLYSTAAAGAVIFYFSGHGMALRGENYIVPQDGTVDEALAPKKNITVGDVLEPLKRNFRTQVLFLDACRSNGETGVRGAAGGGFVDPQLAQAQQSGLCVMFGTELGQVSREQEALGHGLFTAALLAGLDGAAADSQGSVTIGDLTKFVGRYMLDYSQHFPKLKQLPYVRGDYSPLITLAVVGTGDVSSPPNSSVVQPKQAPQPYPAAHQSAPALSLPLDPKFPNAASQTLQSSSGTVDSGVIGLDEVNHLQNLRITVRGPKDNPGKAAVVRTVLPSGWTYDEKGRKPNSGELDPAIGVYKLLAQPSPQGGAAGISYELRIYPNSVTTGPFEFNEEGRAIIAPMEARNKQGMLQLYVDTMIGDFSRASYQINTPSQQMKSVAYGVIPDDKHPGQMKLMGSRPAAAYYVLVTVTNSTSGEKIYTFSGVVGDKLVSLRCQVAKDQLEKYGATIAYIVNNTGGLTLDEDVQWTKDMKAKHQRD